MIAHALLIGASDCSDRGSALWKDNTTDKANEAWQSIAEKTIFTPHMRLYRFKQFRKMIPTIWQVADPTDTDPWCQFRGAIENFNLIRKLDIFTSEIRILDESMSAFRPRTTKLGGLPNISYILRKPEPLGTELKTSVCPTLNIMTFLELCEGKEGMKNKAFHRSLGATAACAVRMAQGTCQSVHDNHIETVMGDSWFGSVKSVVKIKKLLPKEKEAFFQVKTAHRLFPKQYIEDLLKEEPGGTSVKLQAVVEGVKLIALGYKYQKKRVLHFIMSQNAGSTAPGEPYEMKFPDSNGNVNIRQVPRPAIVSEYFKHSNCVDVHNQLRQSAVKLEKKWVTKDPFFRLHTTIVGMFLTC